MPPLPKIETFRREEDYCAFCPKMCTFSCPVSEAEGRESVTPWGKVSAVRFVREEALPLDREVAGFFYKCVDCRRCRTFCVHGNDVPSILTAARALAVKRNVAPPSVEAYLSAVGEGLRPQSPALLERLREIAPPEAFRPDARRLFLPGCGVIKHRPDFVRRLFALFERLGISDVTLLDGSPQCGGYPLYAAGDTAQYEELAEARAAALGSYDTVISACPACTWLIGRECPDIDVVALPPFLLPHVERRFGRSTPPSRRTLLYHDPCFLGRNLGIYDEPRRLLACAGVEVVEFPQNREEAECCGAGGLLPLTSPETAREIARHRLRHAGRGGSEGIVTACPDCTDAFSRVTAYPIHDLVDILFDAFCEAAA